MSTSTPDPHVVETMLRTQLESEPRHRDALHQLGLLCLQGQRTREGADLIAESLRVDPLQPAAHMHLGIALRRLGRAAEAIGSFGEALRLKPDLAEALYNRGNALVDLGRLEEAVADLERALLLRPGFLAALGQLSELLTRLDRHAEGLGRCREIVQLVADEESTAVEQLRFRASALSTLGRSAEALATCDRALERAPARADLWNERGIILRDLKRGSEALDSINRALLLRPDFAEALCNQGDSLRDAERFADALASYERALGLKPMLGQAHRGRGMALRALRRPAEALAAFERAEALNVSRLDLLNQRGNTLRDLGRLEQALAAYDRALALAPDHLDLLWNRGTVLHKLARYAEASQSLSRLIQLAPHYEFAAGLLVHCRLELCDWRDYAETRKRILEGLRSGARTAEPFTLLTLSDSAAMQLECARSFAAINTPTPSLPAPPPRGYRHQRIRLAYLSADLREHAVSYLMAGIFERHDRERFETIGLSLRPQEDSTMGRRLCAAFDRLIDVSDRREPQIAALLRELEVDIAIDLMGYTQQQRCTVFAHRPAPVQVTYLGYPGTMGSTFMDYILADDFVIPPHLHRCYAEEVVSLPECFQANDDRRVAGPQPTRAAVGLPEKGLVFCCFNTSSKLTPAVMDIWCRLLWAVPDSVLWIIARSGEVCTNLKREIGLRGVDPRRVVFAGLMPYREHLGRVALADLFLDTFPFSAGATASDALWAGVPILTCIGEAYSSRMAGSLLRALGLPELITASLVDYERRAIELARAPESLAALRCRLAEHRRSRTVFDSTRFCRKLERAYVAMWERAERGEGPQGFAVG